MHDENGIKNKYRLVIDEKGVPLSMLEPVPPKVMSSCA